MVYLVDRMVELVNYYILLWRHRLIKRVGFDFVYGGVTSLEGMQDIRRHQFGKEVGLEIENILASPWLELFIIR